MTRAYSVVGLGKLGASMSAAIASRGFSVIGVDVNEQAVAALNQGRAPIEETGLEDCIRANRARLRATTSCLDAVLGSDVTFVVVPTPSDATGAFSLSYAESAFQEIGRALAVKDSYHVVALTSTVLPCSSRYKLLPILENASGKLAGPDFGLCYSPEFIALGSVIRDFLNPDFVLIGEADARAGAVLEACYAAILQNAPPCRRMSLENAELAKLALNTYVTTKITYANMLADLCERIPGGDVDVVCDAIGLDSRIGRKYLTGGLGYGGPCFPRDNVALGFLARALGTQAQIAEVTDEANRGRTARLLERLEALIGHGVTVAVLGLAYKPLSHVIEESAGIDLAVACARTGATVVAYDPLAGLAARGELQSFVEVFDSLGDCLRGADVVLIANPDPSFRGAVSAALQASSKPVTVVDFWRRLAPELDGLANVRYVACGRASDDMEGGQMLARQWTGVLSAGLSQAASDD